MKKFVPAFILIFIFVSAFAQKPNGKKIFNTRTYTFSYFGNNLVNPGIKAAINFTLAEKTTVKSKSAKNGETIDKTATKQFLTSAHVGFFWQPESHIGAFGFYEITYKRIKREDNSCFRIGLGPGIYRSFYPGTFEVDENGTVSETAMGGRSYFAPVITFGTGKIRDKGYLHSIIFATNLMFLFDYNSGIVPLLNLEIDFCFDFKKRKK